MTECYRSRGNAKSGINHENHEHTRKGEKRRAALGQAKLALPNQTLWQASLPESLFLNRSSASLLALLGSKDDEIGKKGLE
jgi:hypothetical protein